MEVGRPITEAFAVMLEAVGSWGQGDDNREKCPYSEYTVKLKRTC